MPREFSAAAAAATSLGAGRPSVVTRAWNRLAQGPFDCVLLDPTRQDAWFTTKPAGQVIVVWLPCFPCVPRSTPATAAVFSVPSRGASV